MFRRSTFAFSVLALAACSSEKPIVPSLSVPEASLSKSTGIGGIDDTYLVRFRGSIGDDFAARVAALGGEVIFTHAGAGVGAVRGLSADAANDLMVSAGVEVTPDDAVVIDAAPGELEQVASDGAVAAAPSSPSNPALAAIYIRQWGMRAIEADKAWAAGKLGEPTTKVGILDTGLDYLSPDLYGRVDLASSRSYLSAAENARVTAVFPGAHPVADGHYHGTHVGATVVSNGLVAAGVTSRVTLVGMKVCSPGVAPNFQGTCPTSGTLQAILDAADMGLPVINMSLGGSFLRRVYSARGGDSPSFIAVINDVFQYANRKGTTIVVAAGNAGADMQHFGNRYFSYCDAPHVICVSATGPLTAPSFGTYTELDTRAAYTNIGNKVDVAAPGGTGTNTPVHRGWVYAVCSGFVIVPGLEVCRTRSYNPATGGWSSFVIGMNGTSMAAPHAAGVAALVAGSVGNNPTAIRNTVTATADDRGAAGKDPIYGFGRVNAFRASQ